MFFTNALKEQVYRTQAERVHDRTGDKETDETGYPGGQGLFDVSARKLERYRTQ